MAIWKPLVICGKSQEYTQVPLPGGGFTPVLKETPYTDPCNFYDLMTVASHLVNNLIIVATILTVIACVYAGFILMFSGGNVSAKTRAVGIFKKIVTGYIVILVAWVLVYTITSVLIDNPSFSDVNFLKK